MLKNASSWAIAATALLTLIGAAVTVVYFVQPWRSCDYEDSAAGCTMLPEDATVMSAAILTTLVSAAAMVTTLLLRRLRALP